MLRGASTPEQITTMLRAWKEGDSSALERLTPIVYAELHRLARLRMLAESPGHMLQPSALVNEAFIRLMTCNPGEWRDRVHFFAFASRLMRRILVDFARSQNAGKRGRGIRCLDLSTAEQVPANAGMHGFEELDAALDDLAKHSPRPARVVELRYFGGLENPAVAEILGISEDSVTRDWNFARAWLFNHMQLS